MQSEWPLAPIGEVAQVFDGPHATPKKTSAGPVFLGISSLNNGRLDLSVVEHLSEDDFTKWTRRVVPQAGDVVFSYETRLGQVAIIPPGLRCCLGRRMALVRPDRSRLLPKYFLYYFLSDEFQALLKARTIHGSTVERLPLTDFPSYPVRLPSIETQRQICDVLAAIDDRIDLLLQTNATLESIAQALFKSWFIDFDPVRAKAEGREPEGMDAATAALFPAEFEDSTLGLIPKGWRHGRFGDLAELAKGSVNPLAAPCEKFEHYSLPAFDAGQLPVLERGETIKSNKTRVPARAVLQSKLNPHIPRVWLPSRVGERAVCSTEFLPWVAKGASSTELVYCTLTGSSFEASVRTLVTGTSNSHQRVKPDQVAALELVLAPEDLTAAFTQVVRPVLRKVGDNRLLAKSLSEVRDALLPRLISGKLRLPEAQAQLESALA